MNEDAELSKDDYVGWFLVDGKSSGGAVHVLMKDDEWSLCGMAKLTPERKNESPGGRACKTCLNLLLAGKRHSQEGNDEANESN